MGISSNIDAFGDGGAFGEGDISDDLSSQIDGVTNTLSM